MPATRCRCRLVVTRIENGKRQWVVLEYHPECWWHGGVKGEQPR